MAENNYPTLDSDLTVEVAIVGGGLAGVNTAYLLAKAGKTVAILEKDKLGSGATAATTAFITKVLDTSLTDLAEMYGEENARLIWEAGQTAIENYEEIITKENIDCGFGRCLAYIYASEPNQREELMADKKAADKLGQEVEFKEDSQLSFKNFGYLEVTQQAKFYASKYLPALAKKAAALGAKVFEKTEVTEIQEGGKIILSTKEGYKVTAEKVIIATYDPFGDPRELFAKKGMYKSYALELEVPKGSLPEAIFWDMSSPYYYFRVDPGEEKDTVIFGGADHRSELKVPEDKSFENVKDYARHLLADIPFEIKSQWNGPILEPSDGIALIGEYKPNHFVATAFSGNGMIYSMISGLMFRDLITGKANSWADIYNPNRPRKISRYFKKALDFAEEWIGGAGKTISKY